MIIGLFALSVVLWLLGYWGASYAVTLVLVLILFSRRESEGK